MYEWMPRCMKNKRGKENITLKWWFRWWSDWVKHCYPIKIMWWFMEPAFIDLFAINIFTVSNMNRIMKDPIMKLILFTWLHETYSFYMTSLRKSSRSHHGLYLCPTKECDLVELLTWAQRMIGSGTNTNSKKSTLGLRVSFGSRVESKSKNWDSHSFFINRMWLSKIGDSISKSMGRE